MVVADPLQRGNAFPTHVWESLGGGELWERELMNEEEGVCI